MISTKTIKAFFQTAKIKKILKFLAYTVVIFFALVGVVFTSVFIGMHYGLFNIKGTIDGRNKFFLKDGQQKFTATTTCLNSKESTCDWNTTPEWATVSGGLIKDVDIIKRVSSETGVQSRMIAAVVIPEQTRFFTANREIWKSYFEPLKVLISLSQFSLGISGIKVDTANAIESHLNDPSSVFYPNNNLADLIKYPNNIDRNAELYNRLTNEKDHYYQYLYTALYIKEIESQWQKSGYDISHNPETVVTLFNIGFGKSNPNKDPVSGGAPITVGNKTYSYGELGSNFYYSNELIDIFPKVQ